MVLPDFSIHGKKRSHNINNIPPLPLRMHVKEVYIRTYLRICLYTTSSSFEDSHDHGTYIYTATERSN